MREMKKTVNVIIIGLIIGTIFLPNIQGEFQTKIYHPTENADEKINHQNDNWWHMTMHDIQRTGFSNSKTPMLGDIRWQFFNENLKNIQPIISNDKMYLCASGIYCIDIQNGEFLWRYQINSPEGPPIMYENQLFFPAYNHVYRVDADDGSIIDKYYIGVGSKSSPLVINDYLYIHQYDGLLKCFNINLNEVIWNTAIGESISTIPSIWNNKIYISSVDKIYCLNRNNGNELWNYSSTSYSSHTSPLVSENGRVYVGCFDGLYCLDANDGQELWKQPTFNSVVAPPSLAYGNVYFGGMDSKVYCVNAISGQKIWDTQATGHIKSSVVIGDGKVFIGTNLGNFVYCMDAFTGNVIWRHGSSGGFQGAIAAGCLYYISGSNVFCVDDNHNPTIPHNPFPADQATHINNTITLSWESGDVDGEEVSYDVYFGTDHEPPMIEHGLSEPSFRLVNIESETIYYWRIVSYDINGYKTEGALWRFQTRDNSPPENPDCTYDTSNQELVVVSSDQNNDKIKYGISWDNTFSADQWTKFYDSSEEVIIDCYVTSGVIGIIAEDEHGAQSNWVAFTIKSKQKEFMNPFFKFLARFPNLYHLFRIVYQL